MQVLSCNNISKTYIVDPILEDLSFTVENGDKVGVIGLNGSGKTTLFNILNGDISKDSGDIYIKRGLTIGYLKQHTKIESDKTIFNECLEAFNHLIKMEEDLRNLEEEISIEGSKGESEELELLMNKYSNLSENFSESNGYGYTSSIKGTLKGLGFFEEDLDKDVNILSGGQKSRLSLAKLLLEKPDILLLDEPTNHLDIDAINWLGNFLQEYKGASLIISHDRYFLDNVVNRIFHLENLDLNIYNTNYTNFMDRRKKILEIHQKHFDDQQKEIKRQEEVIEKYKQFGGERYYGLAKSRQKMLDKMKIMTKKTESSQARFRFEPKVKSGEDVLKIEHVEKSFGDFKLLNNINVNIYRGEKVGLIGDNGIGKTTLFKIILGELSKDGGNIHLGHNVFSGYFDQEMSKLNLDKTIIDEIWDENPNFTHFQIRSVLSQFMFIGDDIFKEISTLSGGEKGRISLLKLMLSNANLLFMDEPTNHLDIDSKEVLEDAVLDYEGTLFVISHDRYFLNRVTTKILELTEEGIVEYLGNYDYYLQKKNEILYIEDDGPKITRTQIKNDKRKEKEILKEKKHKQKEISNLEEKINLEESGLKKIDELLCDPDLYSNPDKIIELGQDRENIQEKLDNLYEEWIFLTEA